MKNRYILAGAISLILGLLIFFTDGFGVPFIRHYVGDVLIIIFLYSIFGVFLKKPILQGMIVLVGAFVVEIVQIYIHSTSELQDLFIGSTFDPVDLLIYLLTAIFWVVIDRKIYEN